MIDEDDRGDWEHDVAKDKELDRRWEEARIRVSDVGVLSVDSNELVRSKAGQEQIAALERMTKGE
jgi:hypothetical protein